MAQTNSDLFPIAILTSLENIQLSSVLNGSNGINRSVGRRPQIAANTDVDAIKAWLARYIDSKTTFDNYRKEAERLLLWAIHTLQKPVSSITHEDLLLYQRFLGDPQPAKRWVMARRVGRNHPDWRPFAGPLSMSSQRQAIVILNAMFSWLVNAGYLAGNPLSLSRQRSRQFQPRVTRYLNEELWNEVKLTIRSMPQQTHREREQYSRIRWLFSLLYLCGLRISEVVENTMGGFFCRRDMDGEQRWWLEVTGKGNKIRIMPATTELMTELAHYRQAQQLPALPLGNETTPLFLPIGGQQRIMSRAAIHLIVKQIFQACAERLRQQGAEYAADAKRLEQASAHWLRHTAGSHMANNDVDLRYVRDNLGHESLSTTNHYLHSTDEIRHKETEKRHKINWHDE